MADGLNVDTSSYPKPAAPTSMLDTAGKFQSLQAGQQAIQQNAIGIQQSQLNLITQRFGTLAKQLTALANKPDLSEGDITNYIQNDVKLGILDPEMGAKLTGMIPPKATPAQLKAHLEGWITNGANMMEAIQLHYGVPGTLDTGQGIQPTVTSPLFGIRSTGAPIQKQIPPTTQVIGPNKNPALLGPQPAAAAPGAVTAPPARGLPVSPPAMGPADVSFNPPAVNKAQGRLPALPPSAPMQTPAPGAATGPATGYAPTFDTGLKMYAADQDLATQKLTAIKPALQALPLLKGIMSGPGTAAFTHALAGLKAFGIISTSETDPVAIRQEVVKKLNQYVSSNPVGQRSDAAQTLAEASSPTPNVQVLPALIRLTKDAIALDRVQAARAGAFEGTDYSQYGQHRSTFPASVDERAFGLDLMEPAERQSLLDEMKKKANTFEGKKFWKSLAIVRKQGLINPGGE